MAVELLGAWGTGLSHATATGSNRMMIFLIHTEHSGATAPSADLVEYGTEDMLHVPVPVGELGFVGSADTDTAVNCTTEAWYMLDSFLDLANSPNFGIDWEPVVGPPDLTVYSHILLQDTDQGNPFGEGQVSHTSGNTPNPITTTALNSISGDMVIWGVTSGNDGTYTPNNSFTEGTDQLTASHTGAAAYKVSTGVAETPSATYDGPGNPNRQTIFAFTVNQQVAVRPQDSFTFIDNLAANNTFTLTIGDSSDPDTDVDDLDRGITVDAGGGNVIQQRSLDDTLGPFADKIVYGFTHEREIQEALTFLDNLVRNLHRITVLPDSFTLLENLSTDVTAGDGWVRVGTPVGAWSAAAAPDPSSRFQTLGTFTDVSGGIDFIPVLASGAKGGPYWAVTTDRPTTLRSKSNITSDPSLRP